jgi:DNA polymerase III epsilon subunit-like protein
MPQTINFNIHEMMPSMHRRLAPVFEQFYLKNPDFGTLVFVDTETTGLKDSDIVELGALAIGLRSDGNSINIEAFSQLINPGQGVVMPPWVVAIHGITNEMLRKYGHSPRQVFQRFAEWADYVSPKYFVAHSASFDKAMLASNLMKHGVDFQLPDFLCTVKLAKGLPVENRKLGTLARHFGFVNQQAHRSITDAEACAYIFASIMNSMPLKGLTAVVAGDLPSLSQRDAEGLLRKYGARVVGRITHKATLVVARDHICAKAVRALELGIQVRDEAWLLGLGES